MSNKTTKLIGCACGDINGSIYEFDNSPKRKDFELFQKGMSYTDDTALTIAVAETLLRHYPIQDDLLSLRLLQIDLCETFTKYVNKYPYAGWGRKFYEWAKKTGEFKNGQHPYNSWGNGSAMRISPVGWIANSEDQVKTLSKIVSEVTHNHPTAMLGAEATAMCIYLARMGKDKEFIYEYVKKHYYPEIIALDFDELVKSYTFDVSCEGTVPVAIYAFYISTSFEDCLRNCVAIGGDCDTLSAISCSIAEAYYQPDMSWKEKVEKFLPKPFMNVINEFEEKIK